VLIQGTYLTRGIRMSDYRVVIGNGECNISSLNDSLLTCRPPHDEPQRSPNDTHCADLNSILVRPPLTVAPASFLYFFVLRSVIFLIPWVLGTGTSLQ